MGKKLFGILWSLHHFIKEPFTTLCLVQNVLKLVVSGRVPVLVAYCDCVTYDLSYVAVVFHQYPNHLSGGHYVAVVVFYGLELLGNLSPVIFCCLVLISSRGIIRLSGESSNWPISLYSLTLNSSSPMLSGSYRPKTGQYEEALQNKKNKGYLLANRWPNVTV